MLFTDTIYITTNTHSPNSYWLYWYSGYIDIFWSYPNNAFITPLLLQSQIQKLDQVL